MDSAATTRMCQGSISDFLPRVWACFALRERALCLEGDLLPAGSLMRLLHGGSCLQSQQSLVWTGPHAASDQFSPTGLQLCHAVATLLLLPVSLFATRHGMHCMCTKRPPRVPTSMQRHGVGGARAIPLDKQTVLAIGASLLCFSLKDVEAPSLQKQHPNLRKGTSLQGTSLPGSHARMQQNRGANECESARKQVCMRVGLTSS